MPTSIQSSSWLRMGQPRQARHPKMVSETGRRPGRRPRRNTMSLVTPFVTSSRSWEGLLFNNGACEVCRFVSLTSSLQGPPVRVLRRPAWERKSTMGRGLDRGAFGATKRRVSPWVSEGTFHHADGFICVRRTPLPGDRVLC